VSTVTAVTSSKYELKQLFHLMIPILITQFAQAGFGLIDTIMAGHMSANDLAAIAVGVGYGYQSCCCSAAL
jgi:Na+-driven multidrug efflux pump